MMLEIRNLEVSFGEKRVVDLRELALERGEIVGLVGESGSGKSLTALATLGLATKTGARVNGSIVFDKSELIGASEQQLRRIRGRRIAMIFQSPASAFNPVFRVGDVFERALRLHGASRLEAKNRAGTAMAEVMLTPDLLRRYPHQLSGGQAQRVAIAIAVALRSDLLLADEPTSALDVTVQAEIIEILRRLREHERMSVLFISHDLAVVAELCDRVAVMREGRLVETGPTGGLLRVPRDRYTQSLIAAVPKIGSSSAAGET